MKEPIDKEYLEQSFIDFDTEVSEKKYLKNDDSSIHSHDNKNILDKMGESETGKLLFNGEEIFEEQNIDLSDYLKSTSDVSNTVSTGELLGNEIFVNPVTTDGWPIIILNSKEKLRYKFYQIAKYSEKLREFLIQKIPVKTSQLTNDSNFVTQNEINNITNGIKTITYSTTEPTTVAEDEIVMVYEE